MDKKQSAVIWMMILLIQLAIFGCESITSRYKVANFDDDKSVEIFAIKFKQAVVKNDRDRVASMIKYPVKATFEGKVVTISNAEDFLKFYNKILDKDLINKIARFSAHNMWANYQGVMLGDGDVWFGTSCAECIDIKVIAIGVCRKAI